MAVQTTYAANPAIGLPGQLTDNQPKIVETYLAETTAIEPGLAVQQGTLGNQALLGTGTTATVGVTVRDESKEGLVSTNYITYPVKSAMSVIKWGYFYAYCASSAAKGAAFFATDATGVLEAGTASTGETQIAGTVEKAIAAAGITKFFINLR